MTRPKNGVIIKMSQICDKRKEVRNGMVEKKKASSREEAGKEKIPWWTWVPALIMSVTALMVNLLRIVW